MARDARHSVTVFLVCLLAACGEEAPHPGVPALAPLVRGPTTAGLCLSAGLDAPHGVIRYAIENVGDDPFVYVRGHVGAVLEARRAGAGAWTELAIRPDALRFHSGMGPAAKDLRTLEPGSVMPRDAYLSYVDQRRFTPREGTPRPGLDVPQAAEPFVIDLLDHVWPEALGDFEQGVLELRVVQVHPDWSEFLTQPVWSGRLPSAVLRLEPADLPAVIRAHLDRAGP